MTIGEVSRTIKDRVEIRNHFFTVTANKFSGNYIIVGIIVSKADWESKASTQACKLKSCPIAISPRIIILIIV